MNPLGAIRILITLGAATSNVISKFANVSSSSSIVIVTKASISVIDQLNAWLKVKSQINYSFKLSEKYKFILSETQAVAQLKQLHVLLSAK